MPLVIPQKALLLPETYVRNEPPSRSSGMRCIAEELGMGRMVWETQFDLPTFGSRTNYHRWSYGEVSPSKVSRLGKCKYIYSTSTSPTNSGSARWYSSTHNPFPSSTVMTPQVWAWNMFFDGTGLNRDCFIYRDNGSGAYRSEIALNDGDYISIKIRNTALSNSGAISGWRGWKTLAFAFTRDIRCIIYVNGEEFYNEAVDLSASYYNSGHSMLLHLYTTSIGVGRKFAGSVGLTNVVDARRTAQQISRDFWSFWVPT